MKLYYIVILGTLGSISGAEHNRYRRQSAVSPPQPFCTPTACPQDCGVQFFVNPQNGCRGCRCDPNDTSNPFGPQCPPNTCPADCSSEAIINKKTGCSECKCQDDDKRANKGCEARRRCKDANGVCKKTCDADEEKLKGRRSACKGRRCKCCIKKKVAACTPGDRWTDKCNSCFCPPSGVPTCTLQDCTNAPPGPECRPGDNWTKDCNRCTCLNFRPVCTLKDCSSDRCPQNPPCPADCTPEFIRNPQNGCITCRCSTSVTQVNPFVPRPTVTACPPTQCPADCTTETFRDPNTGCQTCRCSTSEIPIDECPSICPANYEPVCGSDGVTYSNACALAVASCQNPSGNIATVYDGECDPTVTV